MQNASLAECHPVTNKVQVDLDVLSVLMLNRVRGEIRGADVVAVDKCRTGWRAMQLSEQLAKPARFSDTICDGPVLRFGAGPRDRVLALRRPRDEIGTKENAKPRGGFASVRTTGVVELSR